MNIALAVIKDQEKVLIGKIKTEKIDDYGGLPYAFPCEGVQDENKLKEGLITEVKRQTNLDIKIVRKIGERTHPYTKNHTYYFHCEIDSQQTMTVGIKNDFETFIWCETSNLKNYMPTLFEEVTNYFRENSEI